MQTVYTTFTLLATANFPVVNMDMLINDDFIFIHIPKTGGTSIQRVLAQYVKEELHKSRDSQIKSHIPLSKLKEEIEITGAKRAEVKDQFIFAFVRNPWERVQSLYHYIITHDKNRNNRNWHLLRPQYENMGLNDWVLQEMTSWITRFTPWHSQDVIFQQTDWISPEIDFVGRFENLQTDFDNVCNKLNIKPSKLPHKLKTNHPHYTDEFNSKASRFVAELFVDDIEQFKYKF